MRRRVAAFVAAALIGGAAGSGAIAQDASPRNVVPWLERALQGEAAGAPGEVAPLAPGPAPVTPDPSVLDGLTPGATRRAVPGRTPPLGQTQAVGQAPSVGGAVGVQPTAAAGGAPQLDLQSPDGGAFDDQVRPLVPGATAPTDPTATVTVTPLDAVNPAGAGLGRPEDLGLTISAWAGTSADRALELISRLTPTRLYAANRFAVQALSIPLEPPTGATPALSQDLFTARLAALSRYGAHEQIAQIAEAAGSALNPIAVDAALLTEREPPLCDALLREPSAPRPLALARIYCLTLVDDAGGLGAGATLAIQAARTLGEGDETTLMLLEAAADPSLAEFVDAPTAVAEITPLRLAAMRRAGMELPADYARATPLSRLALPRSGSPRAQLEALERLEMSGAAQPGVLANAYTAASSAESGGVWGRVEAFRGALAAPPADTIRSFRLALARGDEAGREAMMARLLAPDLARRAEAGAPMRDALLRRALRLGDRGPAASALLTPEERRAAGFEERAVDRVANPVWAGPWDRSDLNPLLARAARGDQRAGRILAALNAFGVETPDPSLYAAPTELAFLRAEGRRAELVFTALVRLGAGENVSPEDLYAALTMLLAANQVDVARRVAVEAVLIGG